MDPAFQFVSIGRICSLKSDMMTEVPLKQLAKFAEFGHLQRFRSLAVGAEYIDCRLQEAFSASVHEVFILPNSLVWFQFLQNELAGYVQESPRMILKIEAEAGVNKTNDGGESFWTLSALLANVSQQVTGGESQVIFRAVREELLGQRLDRLEDPVFLAGFLR